MRIIWSMAATQSSIHHNEASGSAASWNKRRTRDDTSHGRNSSDRFSPEVRIDKFALIAGTIRRTGHGTNLDQPRRQFSFG
jgi:hypothetical protein